MSKSMNMLRTRRRDNNVKPNRRLDRKSSRGMIYENEELRLKTININAEIERGQSDIKKLKRENDMLKKEIWCLRDEYEKLDKLLKEKDIDFSASSTTCTSESDSCSSCSEDSDQVETSQNLENVQKTNLKNLRAEFDHLSVVPEENSTENSDKNSIPNDAWAAAVDKQHIIKPDQSYPSFETLSKSGPKHFFSPIKISKSYEDCLNNEYSAPHCSSQTQSQYYLPSVNDYVGQTMKLLPMYENFGRDARLLPLSKSSTDLIVKMDNRNFNTMTSSSFSNGGNLEELLNDIESISQDILKLSNPNLNHNGDVQQRFAADVPIVEIPEDSEANSQTKPYKSELNVVLMPTPMPLIGFEKYRNMQLSCESMAAAAAPSMENLRPTSNELSRSPENLQSSTPFNNTSPSVNENPFFFGNFKDSGSSDFFNTRYNPDNYLNKGLELDKDKGKKPEIYNSKTNLLELSSEQVSSENEENLKFKTTKVEDDKVPKIEKAADKKADVKSPKMSIRRKVSIHFKGKKDKNLKNKSLDNLDPATPPDKKHSLFDIKFTTETKQQKGNHQKTPSIDSKRSNLLEAAIEPKTPSSGDSKSDKRNSANDPKTPCPDCKTSDGNADPKKGTSVSPDRKHVHVKEEAKKPHKKHKKNDKMRNRRSTVSNDRFHRERSFSVCTDRSNILGLGFNSAFSMYDDCGNSERERTNSMSSCGTIKMRKMSNISNFPAPGKIPWCGCWGNGCL